MPDIITDPPIAPPTDKPGWQTTEFWVTVFTNLVSLLVGIFTLMQKDLDNETLTTMVPATSFFAATLASSFYAISRSRTKQATAVVAVEKMQLDYDREEKRKAWEITALANAASAKGKA